MFDVRCLMYDGRIRINDNELSAECVLQLIESPAGENQRSLANKGKSKSNSFIKIIQNQTELLLLLNGNLQFEQLLR